MTKERDKDLLLERLDKANDTIHELREENEWLMAAQETRTCSFFSRSCWLIDSENTALREENERLRERSSSLGKRIDVLLEENERLHKLRPDDYKQLREEVERLRGILEHVRMADRMIAEQEYERSGKVEG